MYSTPEELEWHVLKVKPRSEKRVGARLMQLGFKTCVPTQWQLRQWSDRKKWVEVVLFTNYVFVATDQIRKNTVFEAGNIYGYLHFGGKAAVLSNREATMIQQFSKVLEPIQICYEAIALQDEIEIISGSLAGFKGIVIGLNGLSKIQLALPGLRCFANVTLKREEVRKVASA